MHCRQSLDGSSAYVVYIGRVSAMGKRYIIVFGEDIQRLYSVTPSRHTCIYLFVS